MMTENSVTKLFLLTPAAGKRLIAKAFVQIPEIKKALKEHTVVIIAGTTNGYIARELLEHTGIAGDFSAKGFYRGITLPPGYKNEGQKPEFPGDVIIEKGVYVRGKTIFDVADNLDKGDIIVKGANAVDLAKRKAGVLIGHPKGGTIQAALSAVIGKRAVLYIPVGLEKRVCGDIDELAEIMNSPNAEGPRLMPVSGNIVTELDAIEILTGARARLAAAGGICGAEGSCYIAVSGTEEQVSKASEIIESVKYEPMFSIN
ncbi:hypothetical protein Cst_c02710 [Thermoclostridium stercorarium subsp. stercorarium DSM 8532]|jgi:hypothetical protein|uniref:Uncharacterized protein n=2 Tax=Thermoclostridium stercorarium TaxID=1510 RepID=L7VH22_THES1|nr:hypothetical protein [Thermoclostridium stercorarium]AGC67295.1 hypothetical protein Cst_c02710 [Thermoclostridium stercorarium subsp. stercorarium DSM 8532]AGI38360.1 hypothetical protein Clst_0256 [Thermoclostridium stercorarium subsp. stercorarium DSM 8532]ANW97797.1 hypothetical protein CSTERTH_01480 [Thermoclostridium stercorarium subsp. thermolacticum DSM 2910]UZQ85869.1 hypothetical protein ODU73_000243 [Thermoclostridium stercorarium]